MRRARWGIGVFLCALAPLGCGLDLDEPAGVIHARFDPEAKVIPMPTDILRDEVAGTLDIPIEEDLTAAERYLYTQLNQMDGWSSASAAVVELDGAVEAATVNPDTLEVWRWGAAPERVAEATIHLADDGRSITIDAPRTGWERGATYAVVMRGGERGVRGAAGERVECDAAFYFLRLEERLDTPEHERAFPGDTPEERRKNAADLEEIRTDLAPFFDFFAGRGLPRAEVAALWTFTVTRRVELAMDKPSQRMPIPIDLLIDPATGRVDLPPASWDSETVLYAKERLAEFDGFATSAKLLFQLTGPVDPATVTEDLVELWRLPGAGAAPEPVPVSIELLADHSAIEVTPEAAPLAEATGHAIAVKPGLMAADGTGPVALMPAGHLMLADGPVADGDGASLVDPVADQDAIRLERVRAATGDFLARRGRAELLSAWSFTTMTITAPLQAVMASAETLAIPPEPAIIQRQSAGEAIGDFALAVGSLFDVDEVVHGTIRSPVFLGRETRAWRPDGGHQVEEIAFTAVVPKDLPPGAAVPVVIFGHAIMTERRMVLAIGDALASRGIAAVAIDLPFHGTRTYCWSEGPLTIPNPSTGELTEIASPCSGDDVCRADGRCVRPDGSAGALREWPVLPMPMASGAAFLEIEKIANSRDHFRQAEVDLASLARSLRTADWSPVFGRPVDTSRIHYAGQSLGGILGATFTALEPTVSDAVLNVPGADTVDMFTDSPFFGMQIEAFFKREGVEPASFEGHRFLNVARWIMDSVDPASFAARLVNNPDRPGPRRVLLQMATLDFIIPNAYTETLEALSGARRRDYIAEHGFLVIPLEPEYWRGTRDLARFLSGDDP
jgi:hypothetical protein